MHPLTSQSVRHLLMSLACLITLGASLFLASGIASASTTAKPMLVVSPTILNGNTNCTYSTGQGWSCTATLSRGDTLTKNLAWSASATGITGVVFTPASGVLAPGATAPVSISVPDTVCPNRATLIFKGPGNTVKVPWSCGGPTMTLDQSNFTAGGNCPVTSGGWTCTATVGETASSQGKLNWSASSGLAAVTFSPSSGTLSPGGSTPVSIFVPTSSCKNGGFTFTSPKNHTIHALWSCKASTPPPPVLTVSPSSFNQGSSNCSASGNTYQCTVTVGETTSSTGTSNWSASSSSTGVTFSPASGSLTPGKTVSVTIGALLCSSSGRSGSFTFSGAEGEKPVTATWQCQITAPQATLVVTPTSLDASNAACALSGSVMQCTVTLSETASSTVNANWVANSTFSDSAVVPTQGTLTPGSSTQVVLDSLPCQNGSVTFSGSEGEAPVTVTFSCTPNSLAVSPAQLDPTKAICSGSGSSYACAMTLSETAGSPGNTTWTASSDMNGVVFSPSSGTLSPGQSITVNATGIPCQNGSFFFNGPSFGTLDAIATWSCTPPPPAPVLTVTPTSLGPTNAACTGGTASPQCTVTLGETAASQGSANWSVSSDMNGVNFNPSNGILTPGGSVSIVISALLCQNGTITFSGTEGETPVTLAWSCTVPPPVLTITPTSLDPTSSACTGGYTFPQCTVTLGETPGSQGVANWSASSNLSGVVFTPSSYLLFPGGTMSIVISSIPCQNGTFTFSGAEGEIPVSIAWSCTPPPTLTVTPTSLDASNAACTSGSTTYQCTVTLGEAAGSLENANWSASSGISSVTFSPSSGILTPGGSVSVVISTILCQNGSFTFSGAEGEVPLSVIWQCSTPPPVLTVDTTSLGPASPDCVLGNNGDTCTVTLGETANSQGDATWGTNSTSPVTFSPQGGTLSPGGTAAVTITGITCQNETFLIGEISVYWNCDPTTLMYVNPTSLSPTARSCTQIFSTVYTCLVTLMGVNPVTQVNWSGSITVNGVSTPLSGGILFQGQQTILSFNFTLGTPAHITIVGQDSFTGETLTFNVNWSG